MPTFGKAKAAPQGCNPGSTGENVVVVHIYALMALVDHAFICGLRAEAPP